MMNNQKAQTQECCSAKLISRVITYMLHYYKFPFLLVVGLYSDHGHRHSRAAPPFRRPWSMITLRLCWPMAPDDFSGLASDLFRLACVMAVGVIASVLPTTGSWSMSARGPCAA